MLLPVWLMMPTEVPSHLTNVAADKSMYFAIISMMASPWLHRIQNGAIETSTGTVSIVYFLSGCHRLPCCLLINILKSWKYLHDYLIEYLIQTVLCFKFNQLSTIIIFGCYLWFEATNLYTAVLLVTESRGPPALTARHPRFLFILWT